MADEYEAPSEKVKRLEEELRVLRSTAYVTHTPCGGIVETGRITWGDSIEDVAIYVICPICEDIIEEGELSDGDNHYLVRKPQ